MRAGIEKHMIIHVLCRAATDLVFCKKDTRRVCETH
jgi:hypothetical protein